MAFPSTHPYHADSDADDEYERGSVMTSPTQVHTDSEDDAQPLSNDHTPTIFEAPEEDQDLPRTVITEWTTDECAQFVASSNLGQYCEAFIGERKTVLGTRVAADTGNRTRYSRRSAYCPQA